MKTKQVDGLTYEDIKSEMLRRKSQTQKMLEAFRENGELTTRDLMRIGTGCSTRLHTLRRKGHVIVAQYERPGSWRYIYLGQKEDE